MIAILLCVIVDMTIPMPMVAKASGRAALKEVPVAAKQEPARRVRVFNTYPPVRQYNLGSYIETRENFIAHLLGEIGSPQHATHFAGMREKLERMTWTQLRNLHSNDHLGVPFLFEMRPPKTTNTIVKPQAKLFSPTRTFYCPT